MPIKKKPIKKPVAKPAPAKATAKNGAVRPARKLPQIAAPAKSAVKKQKVAAAVIAGKKNKEIAREIGTNERQVRNLKNSPEVQDRLAAFYRKHEKDLQALEALSLKTVKEVMSSKGEDGKTRLSAVQRLQEWQKMGQPKKDINVFSGITYEELETILKERGEI